MGGTQSKTTAELLTEACVNASMDSIMKCANSATQSQLISLNNIKGDVTISGTSFTQGASINMQCLMDSKKQAEISNAVSNAIVQSADSQGQAVLSALGNTKAEATSNITNKLTTNISSNTSIEVTNNISQNQAISAANIGGSVVIKDVQMNQSASIVAKALMQSTAYSSVINESATKMDQTSKSKETTIFSEIGKMLGNLISIPVMIGGAILIVIILLILFFVYVL